MQEGAMSESFLSIHHPEWLTELRSAAEAATPSPRTAVYYGNSDTPAAMGWFRDVDGYATPCEADLTLADLTDPARILWLTSLLADMATDLQFWADTYPDVSADTDELLGRFEKGPPS